MRAILAGTFVVALIVGLFLVRPKPVADVDDKVCDLLTSLVSHGKPSGRVVVVEIDEKSLAQYGRWPWPRDLLGLVVHRILAGGAATVVLDMMLLEADRGTPDSRALESYGECRAGTNDEFLACVFSGQPVLAGYAFQFEGTASFSPACGVQPLPLALVGPNQSWEKGFFHASGVLCGVSQISNAAAGNGFLNASPDSDGKLRRLPVVVEFGDRHFPSLALAAFNVYRRAPSMQLSLNTREASRLRLGDQVVRLEGPSTMRLRFRGPRRTFPYVSAAGVLKDGLPVDIFRDKIVIVGGSALGLPNPLVTPFDNLFPSVEVQATAIDNLLQGDSFNRPAGLQAWELVLAMLAGVSATFLLVRVRSQWSTLLIPGIAAGTWAGCALLLSGSGLLFSPLPVTAVLASSFPVVTLLNYLVEKRKTAQAERQLASAQEDTREMLREGELRYERLVENVNDAIIIDDERGHLVFANRRFRQWFGLEGKDIREVVLEDYVAPEWRATLRDQHERRMNGANVPDHYEYEGIRPGGTRIWLEALVTNLEEDGRIVGTQAALRDITERKRMEAQYLQAQKMEGLGRLAGIVAHDFNNLLTVINGYSDILLTGPADQNAYRRCLMEIRSAGERAKDLTRNLLTFSRKQLAQPKALDLNALVAEAEKMFARLIGEDIELITELTPELGQVMADHGQVHQILMNLLVNARDAMPRGGKVVIQTRNVEVDADFVRRHPGFETGFYVCLAVTDNGTGMTDEVKQHLFEPFYTTKEPGKGTGLGLATIYSIVQQSAGRIDVTTKLGEGTTFHIYLPRVRTERSAQYGVSVLVTARQGSETVLIVEDSEAVRRYTSAVLENAGYCVLLAATGADALALSEHFSGTIDLVLTDLVLPQMNGRELAEKLELARPGVKILFMSGYSQEMIGSRGIIAKDVAYLPKPFSPDELTAKVREVLGNSKTAKGA